MNIFNLLIIGISKKGFTFFKLHMASTLLFAILYWLTDYYVNYLNNKPMFDIYHWLFHSFNTQTAVGLPVVTPDGESVNFIDFYNPLFRILTFAQLFSIFILAAILM